MTTAQSCPFCRRVWYGSTAAVPEAVVEVPGLVPTPEGQGSPRQQAVALKVEVRNMRELTTSDTERADRICRGIDDSRGAGGRGAGMRDRRSEFFRERRRSFERQGFWLLVADDQRRDWAHAIHAQLASRYAKHGRQTLAYQAPR